MVDAVYGAAAGVHQAGLRTLVEAERLVWDKYQPASEIRACIKAVRQATAQDGTTSPIEIETWCRWALAQADRIDPTSAGVLRYDDETN